VGCCSAGTYVQTAELLAIEVRRQSEAQTLQLEPASQADLSSSGGGIGSHLGVVIYVIPNVYLGADNQCMVRATDEKRSPSLVAKKNLLGS